MPEMDVKKAVDFVMAFLPGFVSLALAQAVSDIRLTELEFAYVGVALSIVIYSLVRSISRGVWWCLRQLGARCRRKVPDDPGPSQRGTPTLVSFVCSVLVTLLTAVGVGQVAEHDYIPKAMRALAGKDVLHLSQNEPFYYLLKHRARCTLTTVSPRSSMYRDKKKIKAPKTHKPWVRVRGTQSGLYEGYPRAYSAGRGTQPQIYLAPACAVTWANGGLRPEPLRGNGVLITDIDSLEFVDVGASGCATFFHPSPEGALSGASCPDE